MQILKHPTFRDVQKRVPDDQVDRWLAAGWQHLLTKNQRKRYDELEAEVTSAPVSADVYYTPKPSKHDEA